MKICPDGDEFLPCGQIDGMTRLDVNFRNLAEALCARYDIKLNSIKI